jgi:hypothetical protein
MLHFQSIYLSKSYYRIYFFVEKDEKIKPEIINLIFIPLFLMVTKYTPTK